MHNLKVRKKKLCLRNVPNLPLPPPPLNKSNGPSLNWMDGGKSTVQQGLTVITRLVFQCCLSRLRTRQLHSPWRQRLTRDSASNRQRLSTWSRNVSCAAIIWSRSLASATCFFRSAQQHSKTWHQWKKTYQWHLYHQDNTTNQFKLDLKYVGGKVGCIDMGPLSPLKLDDRFYQWSFVTQPLTNGSSRNLKLFKS